MADYLRPQMDYRDISPLVIPPSDFNFIMPQGTSAQLARAVANRRPHSNTTTPASSQRSSIRVAKPKTRGNSPQYVQRRRTTASHSNREHHTGPGSLVRPHNSRLYRSANHYMPDSRPFSWHPGTYVSPLRKDSESTDQYHLGSALVGLQNLAMDNSPAPSNMQHSVHPDIDMAYGYHHAAGLYQHDQALPPADAQLIDPGFTNYAQPGAIQTRVHLQKEPSLTRQDYYSGYHQPALAQDWRSGIDMQGAAQYPPQQQFYEDNIQVEHGGGEELVGIGLYDDKEPRNNVTSSTSLQSPASSGRQGKELKLEESWQPPNSQDDDEESDDEAEEPPSIKSPAEDAPLAVVMPHGDLSNQSFYFGDDEGQAMGSQDYTTFLALQSQFDPLGDWKGQIAGLDNLMYV